MANKIVHMFIRGLTFSLMVLCLFCNSESSNLTSISHFIMSGVFGGYSIVTMGLLLEAGLLKYSDELVETSFLGAAVALNMVGTILAFYEFSLVELEHRTQYMTKALVSLLAMSLYVLDLILLRC